MNQKQRKQIARMWCAGILQSTGMDAFDEDVKYEDQCKIMEEVEKLYLGILKDNPMLITLPQILEHVLGPLE